MAQYTFTTTWRVRAPMEAVWNAIYHSERWPSWWQGVESVTDLRPADSSGLGGLRRYVWKSALPYRLVIDTTATRVDAPTFMEGRSSGELEGMGRWHLSESDGVTTVRYDWDVATTQPWMNLAAPIARPAFNWNHDWVMARGGEGLKRLLERPASAPAVFHPDRIAYLEMAGWRANYDRDWRKLLALVLQLAREEFGLSPARAAEAAYYITWASIAWVPLDHHLRFVEHYIRRFYTVARWHGRGFQFDPVDVAAKELRYWVVHRELAGKQESEKAPLEDALAQLHAALFNLPVASTRASGIARARAADTVDLITGGRSPDIEADWRRVLEHLREAYASLDTAINTVAFH